MCGYTLQAAIHRCHQNNFTAKLFFMLKLQTGLLSGMKGTTICFPLLEVKDSTISQWQNPGKKTFSVVYMMLCDTVKDCMQ